MWGFRNGEKEDVPEATWEEYSDFYRDNRHSVTVSEYDYAVKCIIYYMEQEIKDAQDITNGIDFIPTNFLSHFYVNTHKGIYIYIFFEIFLFFSF